MEIHKPKPWHGLREFFKEYAIIVLGVLTALAGEQLAEHMRWSARVGEIRNQLRGEISANVAYGIGWLALAPCMDRQLDDLELAASESRKRGAYLPPPTTYATYLVPFKNDAWLNARSLQVADHLAQIETEEFSEHYFFASSLRDNLVQLHDRAAALGALRQPLESITPFEAADLSARIAQAKTLQSRIHWSIIIMIQAANRMGVKPSPITIDQIRREYSAESPGNACFMDPAAIVDALSPLGVPDYARLFETLHLSKPPFPL